ncbi:MAG: class I SAM-dependent methyltransferase [Solirubrobacteraceae bacterium]
MEGPSYVLADIESRSDEPTLVQPADVELAWTAVAAVDGWLTEDQARLLYERAAALPAGAQIVEIGSYRGRSTIVLALAAGADVRLTAIDSHDGTNRGPRQIEGEWAEGQGDFLAFRANLDAAGVAGRVEHVRAFSQAALSELEGPVDLLYIDGAHQYRAARADIRRWGRRVSEGGTMLVHDGFSSIGVTLALFSELALAGSWRYRGRRGSLVEYRRAPTSRLRNAIAHATSVPWFIRNVIIKLALVTRQRWVCRLLGHEGDRWPF